MRIVNRSRVGVRVARMAVCVALVGTLLPVGAGAAGLDDAPAEGIKEQRLAAALSRGEVSGTVTALDSPYFALPTPVTPGTVTGGFVVTDTHEVYSIELAADERVSLSLTAGAETNYDLYLYSEPSILGLVGSSWLDTYPETIVHDVRAPHDGTYYIVVERFSGVGAYTLDIDVTAAPALGPINTIPGVPLSLPTVTGDLDRGTEPDHVYSVTLAAGERLSIVMHSSGGDADVFLFGPGATDVTVDTPVAGAATPYDPELLVYDVPAGAGGTYYVNVWAAAGSPAYELSASIAPTPPLGADAEIPGVAVASSPVVDALAGAGESRVYALPAAAAGQRISLSLTGDPDTDFDLRLFAPGATSVRSDSPVARSEFPLYPDQLVYDVPAGAGGVYYVQVVSYRGSGGFGLSWSVGPRDFASIMRMAGKDRYLTAVDISAKTFADGSCDTVVLATGRDFADALTASGLAGAYEAPVLLTPPDMLPDEVFAEILRLGARNVVIVGGVSAVGKPVTDQLDLYRMSWTRISGSDRFSTAAAVAEATAAQMIAAGRPWNGVAFVVRYDGFADALAVAPLAYAQGMPILLTRSEPALSFETRTALTAISAEEVLIAGGPAAVADHIMLELRGVGGIKRVDRIHGPTRYETAAAVAGYGLKFHWVGTDVVGVATGLDFADALSGGAAAGARGGVLLLTTTHRLPAPSETFLTAKSGRIPSVNVYGGPVAVAESVVEDITRIAP